MPESFEREFLGWDRPALPAVAARLLDRSGAGPIDLSGVVVAIPGSRAGRRLKQLLVEGATGAGRPLRPPRIVTIGGLPELFYRPEAPPPPPLRARLAWTSELSALTSRDLEPLLPRPPREGDLPAWFALARRIESLHRELGAELLTFSDVAAAFRLGAVFDDGARWRVLAGVQQRVLERLRSAGWEDVDRARRVALDEGRIRLEGELWLACVSELPLAAKRMLARVSGPVRVLVHAPEKEAEAFDSDGTLRVDAWARRPLDPGSRFEVAGGPGEQGDRCIRFLTELDGAFAADEIVVGAPDAEVVPPLVQRLDARGVDHRVAEGRPLPMTPPYLLVRAIARHLRDEGPATFAELLRHPHLEHWLQDGGVDPSDAIGTFDRYRERVLPARAGAAPFPGDPRDGLRVGAERTRRRVEELIGEWREERPFAEWSDAAVELVQNIYGDRILEDGRAEDHEIEAFAREVRRVLHDLEDAGDEASDGPGPRVPGHVALQLLVSEVSEAGVPPPGREAAVEILGWLELHLDDAPVLLLTGVNDGLLPRSDVAHPFLPDGLRTALGIPDQRARRARDAYRLAAILQSRERTLLTSGRRSQRGDPLRPSPLLLQGTPGEIAERILRHYGEGGVEGDAGDEPPAVGGEAEGTEAPAEPHLAPPLEPLLPTPPLPLQIGVTSFRTLIEDPYRWLLTRRAGDAWQDDDRRELDPMAFGSLAHEVLEVLGSELRSEADADRLNEGLVTHLWERVRHRFGTRLLPSVRIQVAQLQTRIEALAGVEARERERGWEVVAVEATSPPDGVPFDVDGETVFLRGRVDRVDRHPELGWRLLDYKTSESAQQPDSRHRRGREKRWVDLQLPLYRHLAPRLETGTGDHAGEGLPGATDEVAMGYYNLPRALDDIGVAMAEWDSGELAEADEVARSALRPLLAGEPIAPRPDAPQLWPEAALAPLLGQGILSGDATDGEEDRDDGG